MKQFWKRLENTQGQVSIFIALIFQVLFLFFAMIINVGLLVHHKINLQNSVDLAAYYGAMKQAESLNAIAHINYQIRQDWKLLAWRYRILGSAGQDTPALMPYDKSSPTVPNNAIESAPVPPAGPGNTVGNLFHQPALCMDYTPFIQVTGGQNTCKDMITYSGINVFGVPPATGIVSISGAIRAATAAAINSIVRDCQGSGPMNWILAARFKVAYIRDQGERKKAINLLANGLSGYRIGDTADFRELDGTPAQAGIEKTLRKNLTIPNQETLNYQIYNGLGHDNCKALAGTLDEPPQWLRPIKIKPAFATVTTNCAISPVTGGEYKKEVINVETCDGTAASNYAAASSGTPPLCPRYADTKPEVFSEFNDLTKFVNYASPPYEASLGVEKNPWCMAYVGVKATASPKIPFMPFGPVTLTATAFAKPFGGRIGPWYSSLWSQGSSESDGGTPTDGLVPQRYSGSGTPAADPNRFPNYSRFPGDLKGMMSRAILYAYEKLIYEISTRPPHIGARVILNSSIVATDPTTDESPSFNDWNKIAADFSNTAGNPQKDIMAWNQGGNKAATMRLLELSAVAPDIFDITNYSIEPDYYNNYYKKILEHKAALNASIDLPSDLGSRDDAASGLQDFSVQKQIEVQNELAAKIDTQNNLYSQVRKTDHLLTSWAPDNMLNYGFDSTKFGNCGAANFRALPGIPTPGNCISGGRTGFSVKLVSGAYLKRSDLNLGGSGGGGLKNPPPADF